MDIKSLEEKKASLEQQFSSINANNEQLNKQINDNNQELLKLMGEFRLVEEFVNIINAKSIDKKAKV